MSLLVVVGAFRPLLPRRRLGALAGALLALLALSMSSAPAGAQQFDSPWMPSYQAREQNTYLGFIDTPRAGSDVSTGPGILVKGWVVDQTAAGWSGIDEVHVYDGLAEDPQGRFLGRAYIQESRPDVAAYLNNPAYERSGFAFMIPAGALAPGGHVIGVYAHTPDKGWWVKSIAVTVTP